jgi:hypothetical protein
MVLPNCILYIYSSIVNNSRINGTSAFSAVAAAAASMAGSGSSSGKKNNVKRLY